MKKMCSFIELRFFPDRKMLDCVGTRFQEFLKGFVTAAYAARLPRYGESVQLLLFGLNNLSLQCQCDRCYCFVFSP